MTDTDLHWHVWLVVLAIGLPTLAVTAWKRWRQAQGGFFWRAVICIIVAGIITPFYAAEDFGGFTTIDIFPAVAVFPSWIWGMMFYGGHSSAAEWFEALVASLLPILLVSAVLTGVWSAIIRSRLRRLHDVA